MEKKICILTGFIYSPSFFVSQIQLQLSDHDCIIIIIILMTQEHQDLFA